MKKQKITNETKRAVLEEFFTWLYDDYNKREGIELVSLVEWSNDTYKPRPHKTERILNTYLPPQETVH